MLGRYFKQPDRLDHRRSTRGPRPGSRTRGSARRHETIAGASSSSSLEISPAPRSMPIRVGSTPPSTRPASATANCGGRDRELDVAGHVLAGSCAAPCCTWEARISSGRSRGLGRRHRWAGRRHGTPPVGAPLPGPPASDVQTASGRSPRGVTRPRPVMTTRRSEPSMKDSSIFAGIDLDRCQVQRRSPESDRLTIIAPEGQS